VESGCIFKTIVRYYFKCGKKEKNTIFIRLEGRKKYLYFFNVLRTIGLENGYRLGSRKRDAGNK